MIPSFSRLCIPFAFVGALSGCAGPVRTREVLANPQDATVTGFKVVELPDNAEVSGAEAIVSSGILRLHVEKEAIRVLHYDVAIYRQERTRAYLGPRAFFNIFVVLPALFWVAPLDALGLGHFGSFGLFKGLSRLDEEWVTTPGERQELDVTLVDHEGPRMKVPAEGVRCVVAVRSGTGDGGQALSLPKLRELSGSTDSKGNWDVELRSLARELADQGNGWTLTFSLFPGNVTHPADPVPLSAEQVQRLGAQK